MADDTLAELLAAAAVLLAVAAGPPHAERGALKPSRPQQNATDAGTGPASSSQGVTPQTGSAQSKGRRQKSSRYLGVRWHKASSTWYVQLRDPQTKRQHHIGAYASEEDAARAHDFAAVQLHGPGAKRNFLGEDVSEPPVSKGEERKRGSSSHHVGVSWSKASSAWCVQFLDPHSKRHRRIGSYATEEDAARAYDGAVVQALGEGSERNFLGEDFGKMSASKTEEWRRSSSYVGVAWHKASSSWIVRLWDPQTKGSRHIGCYASEEDAARAYDGAAVQAHGPGAKRNFPSETVSEPPVSKAPERKQSSRYLGVRKHKSKSSWDVKLWDPQAKRERHIGCYASEEDAARAYDCAAVQVHGPGAKRNFPGEATSELPASRGEERKKRSSSYVGVAWHKGSSLWVGRLWDPQDKRSRHIGSYTSEEDAARAHDFAAVQVHGPGAKRNFPGEDISELPAPVGEMQKKQHMTSC
ncbi:hypothetical protein FOA52_008380 [Chlamydomonas sp. UWO 241]|nr:hypothetical protein FOA52_008380 [Chlamydomonas sp. UWO 241]